MRACHRPRGVTGNQLAERERRGAGRVCVVICIVAMPALHHLRNFPGPLSPIASRQSRKMGPMSRSAPSGRLELPPIRREASHWRFPSAAAGNANVVRFRSVTNLTTAAKSPKNCSFAESMNASPPDGSDLAEGQRGCCHDFCGLAKSVVGWKSRPRQILGR